MTEKYFKAGTRDVCSKCGEPGKDFKKRSGECLLCRRARKRSDYLRDPVTQILRSRRSVESNPRRNKKLQNLYNVDLVWYEAKLAEQNGVCFICQQPETRTWQKGKSPRLVPALSVDHNHTTGKVRGLLCNSCNVCLNVIEKQTAFSSENFLQFTSEQHQRMLQYLELHK